jgi:hypothetical protein
MEDKWRWRNNVFYWELAIQGAKNLQIQFECLQIEYPSSQLFLPLYKIPKVPGQQKWKLLTELQTKQQYILTTYKAKRSSLLHQRVTHVHVTVVTTHFFFHTTHKMDCHSGMVVSHKANIWYISHTMYLVYQSITSIYLSINAAENINLNSENHIYK